MSYLYLPFRGWQVYEETILDCGVKRVPLFSLSYTISTDLISLSPPSHSPSLPTLLRRLAFAKDSTFLYGKNFIKISGSSNLGI
jgi:hypothetical protein